MRMTTAKDLPKACWLCGRNGNGDPLDAHHIFGGANRKLSEQYGLVVPLCHRRCHENGKDAVHRNADTARALHEYGQRLAMEREGWSIEEFRMVFGRNYLPEPSDGEPSDGEPSDGEPSAGRSPRGETFLARGKSPKARQREPIPRRFPLETLPDGQGASPHWIPDEGTRDGNRKTEDGGFSIVDEDTRPEWLLI